MPCVTFDFIFIISVTYKYKCNLSFDNQLFLMTDFKLM